ncbi:hypothetical protein PRBRB14_01610 [Hallella multisaccharivorax DSM 17128]|uniref:Protein translocase subunit SecE n=1 Tax=Hallella multisaccharivorax DSM 17128 TaxID=688246 RepID=F8NA52_9BACT|nr:preprotein translocase subunit SecE [Hallella multisaccharivorax]EGN55782.1 preprotein translocase, SecE subunit [Hallella multisaccharivorax DSM 17128]GJG29282.1 hypothetical protein PRBRB14_01610 [Hallella multisaccharivorax DSM 17128]
MSKIGNLCNRFENYCIACYDELAHKTTWPTPHELTHSAVIVLTASLVIAVVVFVMDLVFKNLMGVIYPG